MFKIGDKVIVKRDLEEGVMYGNDSFTVKMMDYRGKEGTIVSIERGKYRLDIDNGFWNWTNDMLDPIPQLPTVEEMEEELKFTVYGKPNYKVGDRVKIKEGLVADEDYDGVTFREPMRVQEGKVLTISDVVYSSNGAVIYYNMEECGWSWSEGMIEPFEEVSEDLHKALELLGLTKEEMLKEYEKKAFKDRIDKKYDELHKMFDEYCDNDHENCKFNNVKSNCFVGFLIEYILDMEN